jgi:PAS domain S-box-containing protein
MHNFFRQNRNILVVALSVFIVSMTSLMFFLNSHESDSSEFKTDVMHAGTEASGDPETGYRNIFEGGEDPFAVIKLDGHIVFTSGNLETITGFSREDLQGRLFFSLIDSEDLPTFFSAFGKVIETGKAVTMIGPFGLVNRYGEYRTSMGSVYPVIEDGRVARIGIMVKDISEELDIDGAAAVDSGQDKEKASDDAPVTTDVPTTTHKKVTNEQKTVKPEDPKETDPATEWKTPKTLRESDPSWITTGKLVMVPLSKFPLFPAHLLLARM